MNNNHHDKRKRTIQTKNNNDDEKMRSYHYPWNTKLPKAVWRGATTCNKDLYGHLPLEDIPRSKLVQSSLDRPDLIDAGFHKLVGKYDKDDEIIGKRSIMMKEAITLEEMSRYKAIIDIDGNNWSARFRTLLCTNSVIIKIVPDFIEQYYHELEPNVHYIPSSLDNITQVVEYVMNKSHDRAIRDVVKNANKWCHGNSAKESLANNAAKALESYQQSLEQYDDGRLMDEWRRRELLRKDDNDFVECVV